MKRLALLPSIALLAACATTPAPGQSGLTRAGLAETSWRFTWIDGADPASPRAALRFEGDRISATAGCNGIGGEWKVESGRIVGGPYVSTKMYCEGLMDQEAALAGLFAENPGGAIDGDRLTLRSTSHSAELVRAQ